MATTKSDAESICEGKQADLPDRTLWTQSCGGKIKAYLTTVQSNDNLNQIIFSDNDTTQAARTPVLCQSKATPFSFYVLRWVRAWFWGRPQKKKKEKEEEYVHHAYMTCTCMVA